VHGTGKKGKKVELENRAGLTSAAAAETGGKGGTNAVSGKAKRRRLHKKEK